MVVFACRVLPHVSQFNTNNVGLSINVNVTGVDKLSQLERGMKQLRQLEINLAKAQGDQARALAVARQAQGEFSRSSNPLTAGGFEVAAARAQAQIQAQQAAAAVQRQREEAERRAEAERAATNQRSAAIRSAQRQAAILRANGDLAGARSALSGALPLAGDSEDRQRLELADARLVAQQNARNAAESRRREVESRRRDGEVDRAARQAAAQAAREAARRAADARSADARDRAAEREVARNARDAASSAIRQAQALRLGGDAAGAQALLGGAIGGATGSNAERLQIASLRLARQIATEGEQNSKRQVASMERQENATVRATIAQARLARASGDYRQEIALLQTAIRRGGGVGGPPGGGPPLPPSPGDDERRVRLQTALINAQKNLAAQPGFVDDVFSGIGRAQTVVLKTIGTFFAFKAAIEFVGGSINNFILKPLINVGEAVLAATDKFRKFEITLSGITGSRASARGVIRDIVSASSNLPVTPSDAIGAVIKTGFVPSNAQSIQNPVGRVGRINDLLTTLQKLAIVDPEQGVEGAQFAVREALAGQFRSLRTRFEVSPDTIASISGTSVGELARKPELVVGALRKFLDAFVSDESLRDYEKLLSVQSARLGGLLERFFANIGDQGFYDKVVGAITRVNEGLSKALGGNGGPLQEAAKQINDSLSGLVDTVLNGTSSILSKLAGRKVDLAGALSSGDVGSLAGIASSIIDSLSTLATGLLTIVPDVINGLVDLGKGIGLVGPTSPAEVQRELTSLRSQQRIDQREFDSLRRLRGPDAGPIATFATETFIKSLRAAEYLIPGDSNLPSASTSETLRLNMVDRAERISNLERRLNLINGTRSGGAGGGLVEPIGGPRDVDVIGETNAAIASTRNVFQASLKSLPPSADAIETISQSIENTLKAFQLYQEQSESLYERTRERFAADQSGTYDPESPPDFGAIRDRLDALEETRRTQRQVAAADLLESNRRILAAGADRLGRFSTSTQFQDSARLLNSSLADLASRRYGEFTQDEQFQFIQRGTPEEFRSAGGLRGQTIASADDVRNLLQIQKINQDAAGKLFGDDAARDRSLRFLGEFQLLLKSSGLEGETLSESLRLVEQEMAAVQGRGDQFLSAVGKSLKAAREDATAIGKSDLDRLLVSKEREARQQIALGGTPNGEALVQSLLKQLRANAQAESDFQSKERARLLDREGLTIGLTRVDAQIQELFNAVGEQQRKSGANVDFDSQLKAIVAIRTNAQKARDVETGAVLRGLVDDGSLIGLSELQAELRRARNADAASFQPGGSGTSISDEDRKRREDLVRRNAQDRFNFNLSEQLRGIGEERSLVGLSGTNLAVRQASQQLQNEARLKGVQLTKTQIDQLEEEVRLTKELQREWESIRGAFDSFASDVSGGFREAFGGSLLDVFKGTTDGVGELFSKLGDRIKAAIANVITDILLMQSVINPLLNTAFGSSLPTSSIGKGLLEGLFGGVGTPTIAGDGGASIELATLGVGANAMGMAYRGSLRPVLGAAGGILTRPNQMFTTVEDGVPEAVVPLRGGGVPVRFTNGGGRNQNRAPTITIINMLDSADVVSRGVARRPDTVINPVVKSTSGGAMRRMIQSQR